MSGRAAPMPPWAQFLLVPAVLVVVWILGQTIAHVLLVFTVSVVVALLLNPLVRILRRLRIPRGLAVLIVFLAFLAGAAGGVLLVIDPIRGQIEEIQQNIPVYTDQAQRQAQNLQELFDARGWDVNVKERADAALEAIRDRAADAAGNILSYSLDVISAVITFIIILVCSIYMLLDAPRIGRFAQRIGGPEAGAFLRRTERTLTEYVKAQMLVSLIIGVSAGAVMWIYGVTGVFALGATYAVAFAAWVFVTEFIPYVGPILGAVPPTLIALFTSPLTALWVVIAFLAIHQLEGHVVVPKIMGTAVGVHPLVVIFGLLVGGELYGLAGILLAIPGVVIIKEAVLFATDRLGLSGLRAAEPERPPPPVPSVPVETPTTPMAGAGAAPTREMAAAAAPVARLEPPAEDR